MAITIRPQTEDIGGEHLQSTPSQTPQKTETQESKKKKNFQNFLVRFSKVPTKEKLFLVQQLSIMIKTGISLSVGLKILSEQTKNKHFKSVLKDIQEDIEKGKPFSEGLLRHNKVFGELFINMISAGESTGRLEEVMKELYIQMKKDYEIVSKVRGAMIYPAIVVISMFVIGILVVVFVLPNLLNIFKEVGGKLPLPTKILIGISDFLAAYGIFALAGFILIVIVFIRFIRNKKGKRLFHIFLLNAPIVGGILQKINLARFCRTLSSLLKTDIALINSFEITSKVLGNTLYREALMSAREKIQKGLNIHDSLEPHKKLFPPLVLQMIHVGEETGSLDDILAQSAEFFEDEVDQIMKNLPTILEPVLILLLGIGVAGMAVAIILPLYSLGEQI